MIALSLGELRPGDTLPSIRDLEIALGVGRAIVRKVYLELRDQGLLEIQHGRRICVREDLPVAESQVLMQTLDRLAVKTLEKVRQARINEISFGRYLLSRALDESRNSNQLVCADTSISSATARARELSDIWGVPVTPAVLQDLRHLLGMPGQCVQCVFTTYHRIKEAETQVEQAGFKKRIQIIPIRVNFKAALTQQLSLLKPGSTVLLFADPADFHKNGQPFADAYEDAFSEYALRFQIRQATSEREILKALNSPKRPFIIVNTPLWETFSDETKRIERITHPTFEIDKASLEAARLKAGIFTSFSAKT